MPAWENVGQGRRAVAPSVLRRGFFEEGEDGRLPLLHRPSCGEELNNRIGDTTRYVILIRKDRFGAKSIFHNRGGTER